MYTIRVVLEGNAPALFNGWSQQALTNLDNNVTGGKLTPEERHEEACEKLRWFDADGQAAKPAIPVEGSIRLTNVRPPLGAFKKAVVIGCQRGNLKEGRTSLGTYLDATMFPDPEATFEEVEVYMHRVWGRRPPRTGPACIVRRPALVVGWRLPLWVVITDDNREPDRIQQAILHAGLLVGIGSWRPEYGRFSIADWKISR